MKGIEAQLDRILSDDFVPAQGVRTLGYVGVDLPPELLMSASGAPYHLAWRQGVSTPRADQWLESSFPGWARSIVEDWAAGRFDALKDVIFTRGEDVSQRLYYYVCELQRQGKLGGPRAHILDIARIDRPSSRRYSENALHRLMQALQLGDADLKVGIDRANALREAFRTLRVHRSGPGHLYEKLSRASLFADVLPLIKGWQPPPPRASRGTLVLAGSAPPDHRMHLWVQSLGWDIGAECYDRDLRRLGAPVPDAIDNPVAAVMEGWLTQRFLARDLLDPEGQVLSAAASAQAAAVILWCTRDDEALAWQVPRMMKALRDSGVAALALTARAWDLGDETMHDIETFLRGLAE